jgi:hypothetical protein
MQKDGKAPGAGKGGGYFFADFARLSDSGDDNLAALFQGFLKDADRIEDSVAGLGIRAQALGGSMHGPALEFENRYQ